MAHSAGQGIRRVVGMRVVVEMKQRPDHVGDLTLVCRPGPHDGLLDLHGRVLAELDAAERDGDQGGAARMGGRDGRANVGAEVHALHGRLVRAVALNHLSQLVGDMAQASGKSLPADVWMQP